MAEGAPPSSAFVLARTPTKRKCTGDDAIRRRRRRGGSTSKTGSQRRRSASSRLDERISPRVLLTLMNFLSIALLTTAPRPSHSQPRRTVACITVWSAQIPVPRGGQTRCRARRRRASRMSPLSRSRRTRQALLFRKCTISRCAERARRATRFVCSSGSGAAPMPCRSSCVLHGKGREAAKAARRPPHVPDSQHCQRKPPAGVGPAWYQPKLSRRIVVSRACRAQRGRGTGRLAGSARRRRRLALHAVAAHVGHYGSGRRIRKIDSSERGVISSLDTR